MAMSFGNPGGYLSAPNQYARILQSMPDTNNGTVYGGLGSMARNMLIGMMMHDDKIERDKASQTMAQALQAMQGTPADTITFDQPTRPDGTGAPTEAIPAVPGNTKLAAQLLSSNPYTAQMGYQLTLNDMQNQQQEKLLDKRFQQQKELRAIPQPTSALPAAPIQNFTKRQQLVDQFGENSAEVRTFDNYVRALPFLNAGPAFVQPGIAGSNTTPQVVPKGLNPGDQPVVKGQQAEETASGKIRGENTANAPQAAGKMSAAMAPLDRLNETVDEILKSPGLDARTGLSSYVPSALQGDDARNMQAKMTTLKSQIAQNVLQMYRNMSQAGGAVGQVSDSEQVLFQNNLAALDQAQTMSEFMNQLQKIQQFVKGSKERLSRAYEAQYGAQPQQTPQSQPAPAQSSGGIKFLGFE